MLIPQGLFDIYNEFADDFIIDNFGVNCVLSYPAKKTACPNCDGNTMVGGRASNFQPHGGPAPFNNRQNCSVCGGQGFYSVPNTETIKLRCYFNKKEWAKLGVVNIPDNSVVVIGFMSDLPKFKMANEIVVCADVQAINTWAYIKSGEPIPHGFKKNRYFMGILSRMAK